MEEPYDYQAVFDRYTLVDKLPQVDIFHLYDTGQQCKPDNSGYHDSRHFELWGYNTQTMQKANFGRHDGIQNINRSSQVKMIRIYADGSTMIRFTVPVSIYLDTQCIVLN